MAQPTGKRNSVGPRTSAAISAGKLTGWLARRLGRGGGTALPGLIAERLDPRLITRMVNELGRGTAMVTGTNGKTTTTRMLSTILNGAGWRVLHNRSGSNLMRGLVSTLVSAANLQGHLHEEFALFEVDEAATPAAVKAVQPRLLLINNLFRDQLDRYGEVDTVRRKWVEAIASLGAESVVLLNADAPAVASLGQGEHRASVRYFGLNDEDNAHNIGHLPHASDALNCPHCGATLIYDKIYSADSGIYHCPNCDFARPQPDYAARRVQLRGPDGSTMLVASPDDERELTVRVPGLYNAYNALAATAAACELGLSLADAQMGLLDFHAAFGRIERITVGDKKLLLTLVKNPVGFNEVLRMLKQAAPLHLLIIINDLTADGRDISWLWDVDFEILADLTAHVTTAGIRSDDMALRLKYAGVAASLITPAPADNLRAALDMALAATPADTTLYVLPTYTAMLQLRHLLGDMGVVGRFWEDLLRVMKRKLTFLTPHSSLLILLFLPLLLGGCAIGTSTQQATTFEAPVWSSDGTQVAYFRRDLTTTFDDQTQQLEIGDDHWNLCINNAVGNAEKVIVPDSKMFHPLPDQDKYETIANGFALTWPLSGTLRYYVYGRSLTQDGLPALTDGVHEVNSDGTSDKVIAPGTDISTTLTMFDQRRVIFGDLTLYGQRDSPSASRTIMIANSKTMSVSLYLQDPTAGTVEMPSYEQLIKGEVDVQTTPTP